MSEDMFPDYWNQTITIYHKNYTLISGRRVPEWSRRVVTSCFIGDVKRATMQSNHDDRESERFVRIPISECDIVLGDVVAFGTPDIDITPGVVAEDIRNKIDGILVRSVKNNTFAPVLKHYYVSGV
ncbi:MAG: hypothetical protein IJ300_14105 [Clostridia bacterium]|nr:hypothetical protein [Clostridia bacterium]